MAIFAATDYFISVNGVNLSPWCRSVDLPHKAAALDATAFTAGTKVNLAGLKEWSLAIGGNQDYAAGGPDATLNALVGGAAVTIIVRSTSGADSATNPSYTGSAICTPNIALISMLLGSRPAFVAAARNRPISAPSRSESPSPGK